MAADETLRSTEIVESGSGPGRGIAVIAVAVVAAGVVFLGLSRSDDEATAPTTTTGAPPTTIDQAGPIIEPGPGIDVGEVRIEPGSLSLAGTAFLATSTDQGQVISSDGFTWERVRGALGVLSPVLAEGLVDIRSVGCGVDICLQVRDAAGRIVAAGPTPIEVEDAGPYIDTSAQVEGAARTEAGWTVVLSVTSFLDVPRIVADLRPELNGEIGGWSVNAERLLVDVGGEFVEIATEQIAGPDGEVPGQEGAAEDIAVLSSIDGATWELIGTMPNGSFVGLDIVEGDPYVLVAGPTLDDPVAYVGSGGVARPWDVRAIPREAGEVVSPIRLLGEGSFVYGSGRRFVGLTSDLASVTFEPPILVEAFDLSADLRSFIGVSSGFGAAVWSDDGGETFEVVEVDLPAGTAPAMVIRSGDRAVISVFDTADGALASMGLVAVELTPSGG